MGGAERLEHIAFYVSIGVIIGIALAFALLYFLYGFYKKLNVRNGHEDADIKEELKNEFEDKVRKKEIIEDTISNNIEQDQNNDGINNELNNSEDQIVEDVTIKDDKKFDTYHDAFIAKGKRKKTINIILNCVFGLFYAVIAVVLVFGIVFKANNRSFFFGDTTVLTIRTGSMEKANNVNEYLKENDLLDESNRIIQYSLIGIDKVKSEDDLKLYDIAAYKNSEGQIIVHRIIRIDVKNDKKFYTFRGDANAVSSIEEKDLPIESIIGKYNGFNNYGLGVVLSYLQANIGIISIVSALVFLISYNVCEDMIDSEYNKRKLVVLDDLDKENVLIIKKEEENSDETKEENN